MDGVLALLYLDLPFAPLAVPDGRSDFGMVPYVAVEVVLLLYLGEVFLDLTASGIESWPVRIGDVKQYVDVGWHVTHHSRVAVLEPSP